jgi:hypothetical protein
MRSGGPPRRGARYCGLARYSTPMVAATPASITLRNPNAAAPANNAKITHTLAAPRPLRGIGGWDVGAG